MKGAFIYVYIQAPSIFVTIKSELNIILSASNNIGLTHRNLVSTKNRRFYDKLSTHIPGF